jgi:hypothetical protein
MLGLTAVSDVVVGKVCGILRPRMLSRTREPIIELTLPNTIAEKSTDFE